MFSLILAALEAFSVIIVEGKRSTISSVYLTQDNTRDKHFKSVLLWKGREVWYAQSI